MAAAKDRFPLRLGETEMASMEHLKAHTCFKKRSDIIRAALSLFEQVWLLKLHGVALTLANSAEFQSAQLHIDRVVPEIAGYQTPTADSQAPSPSTEFLLGPEEKRILKSLLGHAVAPSRSHVVREALNTYSLLVRRLADGWVPCIAGEIRIPIIVPGVNNLPMAGSGAGERQPSTTNKQGTGRGMPIVPLACSSPTRDIVDLDIGFVAYRQQEA